MLESSGLTRLESVEILKTGGWKEEKGLIETLDPEIKDSMEQINMRI